MSKFKKAKAVMLSHSNIDTSLTLYKTASGKPLHLSTNLDILSHHTNQHLYIISDDEIKEGDWIMIKDDNYIFKSKSDYSTEWKDRCKIIATTDASLGLPQPSQQFIEKYIEEYNKGNVITDVLVEELRSSDGYYDEQDIWHWKTLGLKINPKDNTITIKEVKDNYTREEVDRMLDEQASRTTAEMLEKFKDYKSREEVIELITDAMSSCTNGTSSHCQDFDKWIEENL